MSEHGDGEEPRPQQQQAEAEPEADPNNLTEEEMEYFGQILNNIDTMHTKLQKVKTNMVKKEQRQPLKGVNQIAETLLQAKEQSEIVNRGEELGSDVNSTLEQTIVEVYSKNQLMKQKIEELAKTIVEKNKKIAMVQEKYDRQVARTKELEKELQESKKGRSERPAAVEPKEKQSSLPAEKSRQKRPKHANNLQSDDYDFWNADPTDNIRKKREQPTLNDNSGLWVNQEREKSTFVTQKR